MTKRAGSLVSGVAVAAAAVATIVSTGVDAEGLKGLDTKLQATGRVATPPPQTPGRLAASSPDAGTPERTRDPRQALVRIEDESAAATETSASANRANVGDDEELQHTDGAVAACRIEVARRRRLPPARVAAGSVVLRFTIEQTGRVREAEALSAIDTDLEVAACAKRVLSEWTFPKRARFGAVVVERTYRFSRS